MSEAALPVPSADANPGEELAPSPAPAPAGRTGRAAIASVPSLLRTLVIAVFILTFLQQPFQIPSSSMENTLLVGDYVLVDKVHYAQGGVWGHILPYEPIRRGDVIVFRFPINPEQHFVKRVIGVPGDHIRMFHKRVYVNGALQHEDYAVHIPGDVDRFSDDFPQPFPVPSQNPAWWMEMRNVVHDGELIVPPQRYFVLGDNRDNSDDSRYWGFVPRENVEGRPLLIYWSMDPRRPMASELANDKLSRLADIFYYLFQIPRWRRAMHIVK